MNECLGKKRVRYMHTVDGKVADFNGDQIVIGVRTRPIKLRDDLKQIKIEQHKSKKWRSGKGFENRANYGHVRVVI